jgi:carboxylesterase type B
MEGKHSPASARRFNSECSTRTAFWVSFAANPTADPRDHLGQPWPKYTATNRQIVVFGNATGPSASYVAPVEIADNYSGPC